MPLYRLIFEVHGIWAGNSLEEAKGEAEEFAQNCRWILKSVRLDNPEEDKTFKYPKEVQELIGEERRRRHRG